MKILFVTTISNTINAFLIPHIKYLLQQGHEVDVACNIVNEVNEELTTLRCKIHHIEFQRSPLKKDNLNAYGKIRRLVLAQGYELIHTHTPVASFVTRLACRNIAKVKVIYTAHGFHFFKGAPLKNWLLYYTMESIAARWTDGIITINDEDYSTAHRLKLRKPGSVFKVHGVGVDLNMFTPQTDENKSMLRKEYHYTDDEFILLYTAELNYNKHQDLLIDAVNLLKNEMPNIKLLLAGDGSLLEHYRERVKELQLENYVHFLGYRKDISNLLRLSDIAVSSSRREGLPVNVMEAMATGLPLVVTDCRGNRDLVSSEKNGYVIDINDIEAYSKAIEGLSKSEGLRRQFAKESLEIIRSYSLENVIAELGKVYANFL